MISLHSMQCVKALNVSLYMYKFIKFGCKMTNRRVNISASIFALAIKSAI